jgi:hypothetical protein
MASDPALILEVLTWWYIALLILLSVGGVVDDVVAGHPRWHIATELASGAVLLVFVLAWRSPEAYDTIDGLFPAILVATGAWELFALRRDYREITSTLDEGDSGRLWVQLRTATYALMIMPAYACGALNAVKAI